MGLPRQILTGQADEGAGEIRQSGMGDFVRQDAGVMDIRKDMPPHLSIDPPGEGQPVAIHIGAQIDRAVGQPINGDVESVALRIFR